MATLKTPSNRDIRKRNDATASNARLRRSCFLNFKYYASNETKCGKTRKENCGGRLMLLPPVRCAETGLCVLDGLLHFILPRAKNGAKIFDT